MSYKKNLLICKIDIFCLFFSNNLNYREKGKFGHPKDITQLWQVNAAAKKVQVLGLPLIT